MTVKEEVAFIEDDFAADALYSFHLILTVTWQCGYYFSPFYNIKKLRNRDYK